MFYRSILTSLFLLLFVTIASAQQSSSETITGFSKALSGISSLSLTNGVSSPLGDFDTFADQGFNSNFKISKDVCSKCKLDLSFGYNDFRLKDEFIQDSTKDYSWESLSVALGPKYTVSAGKFSFDLYGSTGISFINTPNINNTYENTRVQTTRLDGNNIKALTANIGLNLNFQLCEGLELFLNTEYAGYINSEIVYKSRDVSKAIGPAGVIDPDLLQDTPFETQTLNLSHLNMNAGFRVRLGRSRSNSNNKRSDYPEGGTRATDYNSSRSNTEGIIAVEWQDGDDLILRKRPGRIMDDGSGSQDENGGTRATDYNSSRSNTEGIIDIEWQDGEDIILRKRPGRIMDDGANTGSGNETGATRATDYNSSRSNSEGIIAVEWQDGDDLILRKRPGRIENYVTIYTEMRDGEDITLRKRPGRSMNDGSGSSEGGGTKAQDYNSSRSNNESQVIYIDGEDITLRKRPGRIMDDGTGSQDENGDARATDYNSSRSNSEGIIAIEWQDGEDIVLRKRPGRMVDDRSGSKNKNEDARTTDYNSSRSNTTSSIAISVDMNSGRMIIQIIPNKE